MKIELTEKQIEKIANKVATRLREAWPEDDESDYVSTKEAAAILNISPDRLRHLKDKFPHIKVGNTEQGKLLFKRTGLLKRYADA